MNKKDVLWQNAINAEKQRFVTLPAEEFFALDFCTPFNCKYEGISIEYALWHESPDFRGVENHAFILQSTRRVFLCLRRNYLEGFCLDQVGNVLPIPEETFYAYD